MPPFPVPGVLPSHRMRADEGHSMSIPKTTPLLLSLLLLANVLPGEAAPMETYVAGGVLVTRGDLLADITGNPAPVDDGGAVCSLSGPDVGGACIDFGTTSNLFVRVDDAGSGTDVAFQVCIDNDGDSACGSPAFLPCGDDLFFSHDDSGGFHNPLGPLPTGFRSGCPGGPHNGYVVLLCEGVHAPAADDPHAHAATTGTVSLDSSGTGFGDFCGPNGQQGAGQIKRYEVVA